MRSSSIPTSYHQTTSACSCCSVSRAACSNRRTRSLRRRSWSLTSFSPRATSGRKRSAGTSSTPGAHASRSSASSAPASTGRFKSAQPTVYYPFSQEYLYLGHAIVRTTRDPAAILPELEGAISRAGAGGELKTASTDAHLSSALALDRLITTLVGVCGIIALAMSTIGIYGVMTDTVRRRTREIGVRVALVPDVCRSR